MNIKKNIPIKPFTTFDIGGDAAYYSRVRTMDDLYNARTFVREHVMEYYVLAGGSNTLFTDDTYHGLVMHITMDHVVVDGEHIMIGAGAELMDLLIVAAQNGLSGVEKLAGIPGSVGGAVRGNAGAFGVEMADVVQSVDIYDMERDCIVTVPQSQCAYGYRTSIFKKHPHYIILSATVRLTSGKQRTIEDVMYDTIAQRNKKHLQNIRSAGSFFINPVVSAEIQEAFLRDRGKKSHHGRVPAGWLLESVGLAHKRIGDIQAGKTHANYFINVGEGTAQEAIQLASLAKTRVRDKFGVQLKEEVQLVGL